VARTGWENEEIAKMTIKRKSQNVLAIVLRLTTFSATRSLSL